VEGEGFMRIAAKRLVAVLILCAAGLALAQQARGMLYVKARNTRLMASPSPTADVVAILQPGQQVTWLGADAKNKQWHQVQVEGKPQGVVFQSNLSKQPPKMELVTKGGAPRQYDPVAFANSGAAVKGLSKGAIGYGESKGTGYKEATQQILKLEELAKKVSTEQLARHASQAKLFPVVGPQETASRGGK
jgi:uncharacterized protein YgiM (DUF1202 family)